MGVGELLGGYLIGVLIKRGYYYLGVYIRGPPFSYTHMELESLELLEL